MNLFQVQYPMYIEFSGLYNNNMFLQQLTVVTIEIILHTMVFSGQLHTFIITVLLNLFTCMCTGMGFPNMPRTRYVS